MSNIAPRPKASRSLRARLGVLPVLALGSLALLSTEVTGAPPASHQPNIDTVAFRAAAPSQGLVLSIDEFNALIYTTVYPRSTLDWIAFNGPEHVPAAMPERNLVDVLQLITGEQLLGRVVKLDRDAVTIDTGTVQSIPFGQVSAVVFCDAPCLVTQGVPVDPLVLATEAARIAVSRTDGTAAIAAPAAPPPPAAPLITEDPLAAIRSLVQAPPTAVPPPTAALPPLPTATATTVLPIPLVITGTPSATR